MLEKVGAQRASKMGFEPHRKPEGQLYVFIKSGNCVRLVERRKNGLAVVERVDGDSVGKQMLVSSAALKPLEQKKECKRLPLSPQEALYVMSLLETGDWLLCRNKKNDVCADADNFYSAWSVERQSSPFRGVSGLAQWRGQTPLDAFRKAASDLRIELPEFPVILQ